MASSAYYKRQVANERGMETGAVVRARKRIKQDEKDKLKKAAGIYAKKLIAAKDSGENTSYLKDKARKEVKAARAKIRKEAKEALNALSSRTETAREQYKSDRRIVDRAKKDAGEYRSFMTPSRKGTTREDMSDSEIRAEILKNTKSGPSAQTDYETMQRNRKASGGSVKKKYAYGGRVARYKK